MEKHFSKYIELGEVPEVLTNDFLKEVCQLYDRNFPVYDKYVRAIGSEGRLRLLDALVDYWNLTTKELIEQMGKEIRGMHADERRDCFLANIVGPGLLLAGLVLIAFGLSGLFRA